MKHFAQFQDIHPEMVVLDGIGQPWKVIAIRSHRMIACVAINKENKPDAKAILFSVRKNNHLVQVGKKFDDIRRTLFTPDSSTEENIPKPEQCAICCDRLSDQTLYCSHKCCSKCLLSIASKSTRKCPFCRAPFAVPKQLLPEYSILLEQELSKTSHHCNDLRYTNRNLAANIEQLQYQYQQLLRTISQGQS